MSEPIHAQSGIIDKYIGDGIMAYWGPPFNEEGQHARLASFAALDMIDRIGALNDDLLEQLDVRRLPVPLDMRIGIATGKVVVGSIGSELMMNYTVIGDTVNLASRLEGANKIYGCRILASEETVKSAGDTIEVREIDKIVVAGQTRAETVFEILGRKGTLNSAQIEFRTLFAEGLSAYRHRQWDAALKSFKSAMAIERNDGASQTFFERIQGFLTHPPAEGWDGSWKLENK